MQNVKFEGTWKLVSCEARSSKGEVTSLYGKNPFGMLMYDSRGNMSALLMRPDRPKFASNNPRRGTKEEIEAAFKGFLAYCGTYEINEEKETITHHIKGSMFPNWVGTDQIRLFKYSGNQLRLTTPPIQATDKHWTLYLTWTRANKINAEKEEANRKDNSHSPEN